MKVEPSAFCNLVMHDYERQWAAASGHAVRHPLRLKMERLRALCETTCDSATFEKKLLEAQRSDDVGAALLASEILPLWQAVRNGAPLPLVP